MDLLRMIALLLAAACAAASLLGQMGAFSKALDVLNHFAPVILAASSVALAVNVGAGSGAGGVGLSLAAIGGCFFLMTPEFVADRRRGAAKDRGPGLKVVQFNLWAWNADPQASLAWIRDEDADIVVLQETVRACRGAANALAALYPHRSPSGPWPSAATILAKAPITDSGLFTSTIAGRRAAAAWASFGDGEARFSVVGVHLTWPIPPGRQQAQLERLARELERFDPASLILAGDFNSTPWSFTLRRFDKRVGLERRTRALATWPVRDIPSPVPFLAIDHVYAGSGWRTVSVSRGPRLGSDHLPVVVVLERVVGGTIGPPP